LGRGWARILLAGFGAFWQARGMSIVSALKISRQPVAAFAIVGIFWGAFSAHVPVLKAQIGAGDALFGMLMLCSGLGVVSAMWLAPRIVRRFGGASLPIAAVLFAAMFLLPALTGSPLAFGLAMVLVGATSGLTDVVMNIRVSELEAASKRSLMNANHGVFSLAYGLAALVSGAAREAGLTPVPVFTGLAVVCFLLALTTRHKGHVGQVQDGPGIGIPLRPVLLCGAVVLIAFMSEATVESWSALHIERTLSGSGGQGAMGPATLGIMMAIGRFGGQAISARVSDYTVIIWGAALSVVGLLIAAAAPIPAIAYLGFGVLGLGVSVIGPIALVLAGRLVSSEMRTEVISRVAVIGFSAFFIAPVMIGFIAEGFGLRVGFVSAAAVLLLVFPLVRMIRRLDG